jgi:hypothetical protein
MQPAWVQGLTTCLQAIATDADDLEVELGKVKIGELRPRAFRELQKRLTNEQVVAFGWFALADVACWPQLDFAEAHALATSIEAAAPALPAREAAGDSMRDAGYRAVSGILVFITQAQHRVSKPSWAPGANFELIRGAINDLARFRRDQEPFWQEWLRRVIKAAAVTAPEQACRYAVAALRATIALLVPFEYEALRPPGQPVANKDGPFDVLVVTPRQGGAAVTGLGQFTKLKPVNRVINAVFAPRVPIDPYRMGYLLRTECMAELLDNSLMGYFDGLVCTNASTGETWSYIAV